ncbi:hypothetical protein K457DRAFT_535951 [Linnemannia elongata AG-77]|uniref:Uncharacterized protein n=1 Tax=Linnemannia elongata AG-77 TaxID=1314771 RepID=A0A197JX67_9FUNG|nr:hypothetical protein K457DRAFT_535951 [Linnemannia elongata AG-77]
MCNKKKRNHKRPQKPTKGTGSTRTFALFTSAMRIDSNCLPISYPPTPTLLCLSVPYSVLFFPLPLFSGLFFVDLSPAFFFFPFAYSIIPLQNATKKKKSSSKDSLQRIVVVLACRVCATDRDASNAYGTRSKKGEKLFCFIVLCRLNIRMWTYAFSNNKKSV